MEQIGQIVKYFGAIFIILYGVWYSTCQSVFTQFCVISGLAVIAWTLAYFLYERVNTNTVDPTNKAVLVTGCDTGFGNSLVQRLDKLGFHVFAGVLAPEGEGAKELVTKCSNKLKILKMDVTKQEDVQVAAKQIQQSGIPLWCIVNNAGVAVGVPFDWGNDVDEFRKVFDVNVFGMVRVTKNCMPLLRLSHGRVVNVTSVAGRVPVPGMSHYCMSKHAARVFSDVARRELSEQNISLVVIEPIFYKTPIINFEQINKTRQRIFSETPEEIKQAYTDEFRETLDRRSRKRVDSLVRTNLDEVVDAMQSAVTLQSPKLYYRCCGYADVLTTFAASHLPEILLDWVFKYRMKMA